MSELQNDPGGAAGPPEKVEPQVRAGAWYEDQWISPYVRADFPVAPGPAKLVFSAYVPAAAEVAPLLTVRLGLEVLRVVNDLTVDDLTSVSIDLPHQNEAASLPISLRLSKPFATSADERDLGVVLTEWAVVSGAQQ